MRKVVINRCFGRFGLSQVALESLAERKGLAVDDLHMWEIARDDADLVAVVEQWGTAVANGDLAELKIVEVPADVMWMIKDYDGMEWVVEVHRMWS